MRDPQVELGAKLFMFSKHNVSRADEKNNNGASGQPLCA